jgi:hypothetical protein
MVKFTSKTFVSIILGVASEIAVRDMEIEQHHADIERLKNGESQLALDNANLDYSIGVLKGQVGELTERLQLSEDSNKNMFNENASLVEQNRGLLQTNATLTQHNRDLLQRDVETSTELDAIKEGTPPVLATAENVRKLLLATKTKDTIIIAEAVHLLMDTPLVEAMAFVKQTMDTAENGELIGPIGDDEETSGVEGEAAKEVARQVG